MWSHPRLAHVRASHIAADHASIRGCTSLSPSHTVKAWQRHSGRRTRTYPRCPISTGEWCKPPEKRPRLSQQSRLAEAGLSHACQRRLNMSSSGRPIIDFKAAITEDVAEIDLALSVLNGLRNVNMARLAVLQEAESREA